MLGRNVGKWSWIAFFAWTGVAALSACGSDGNSHSGFDTDAGEEAGSVDSGGGLSDATVGDDGPSLGGFGDAGSGCVPKTCAQLGFNCGQAVDPQCGKVINCNPTDAGNGGCTAPAFCGGGGPNQCGLGDGGGAPDASGCTPKTCQDQGFNCGQATDTCGNIINCNTSDAGGSGCTSPAYCGGGGPNQCGVGDAGTVCTPTTTCASQGFNCGYTDDGCGNSIPCGTCTSPQYCGGGGPNICGPTSLAICDAGGSTTLTGYVYDPANHLPVYNALVYVPVGAPPTMTNGVDPSAPSCGCTAPAAYASAFTDITGKFTLTNPPSGSAVTVVVQLGKWQRVFSQSITACSANSASNGTYGTHLTLPSTHAQGNIPLFAVDTGNLDAMECVLAKMGIATSEFVDPAITGGKPTAAGRVHFYQGSIYNGGAIIDSSTPKESALTETASVMDSYDAILFACQGGAGSYTGKTWPNTLGNLVKYADAGGRFFATHYHYDLLQTNGEFANVATWTPDANGWANFYADTKFTTNIASTFDPTLGTWLLNAGAATNSGGTYQTNVGVIRQDVSAVTSPAQLWLSTANDTSQTYANYAGVTDVFGNILYYVVDPTTPTSPGPGAGVDVHFTFDTPFTAGGTAGTCGRGVFSDFHVESDYTTDLKTSGPYGEEYSITSFNGLKFPNECPGGTSPTSMTPQEELLEFMLFDLTSCVSAPVCTPLTCAQLPVGSCGPQGDGCGGTITCTPCAPPEAGTCTPQTCAQQHLACGDTSDGCGNIINCGMCAAPLTCGGGGVSGQCGTGGTCTPKACTTGCGIASDGCGNIVNCPTCPSGQSCVNGQCVVAQ